MKVVILAGGFGTRLSEETELKPKPMVEIGNRPMLWHIMKIYSHYDFNEFVILLGYKGDMIKKYFADYFLHRSDVTIDIKNNQVQVHTNSAEPWKVTLLDTGMNTMTGGRIKRAHSFLGNAPFMLTYGDGVSDVDVNKLLDFHRSHGKLMTITSVQPEGRFGVIDLDSDGTVNRFLEKPHGDNTRINGGFLVCEPGVFDFLEDDTTVLEKEPMEKLCESGNLSAYRHDGFWYCMDTLRDKIKLNNMWEQNNAPWKLW